MRFLAPSNAPAWLASLLLVACGGGGDSAPTVTFPQARTGTPSAAADLTAANADALSAESVRLLLTHALDGDTTSANADPSTVNAVSGSAMRQVLARRAASGTRERAQAVVTISLDCLSGTGSVTADLANSNVITAGDTFTATMNNCVLDNTLPAASGQFTMRWNIVEGSASDPVALDMTMTMNAFELSGLPSLTGSINLYARAFSDGTQRGFTRYNAVRAVSGGTVQILDWDLDEVLGLDRSIQLNLSGNVQIGGQTYAVQQVTAFRTPQASSTPTSGRLDLIDAQGDHVSITASDTLVLRDFLPAVGAAVGLPTHTWTEFLE